MSAQRPEEGSPVFVVGMPRSGTTLLSDILTAHPDLAVSPETHYYRVFHPRCDGSACLEDTEDARAFVRSFLKSRWVASMGLPDPVLNDVEAEILAAEVTHPRILGTLMEAYAAHTGKPRWGEKTPAHLEHVPTIHDHFPEARFVGIVRDPRDVSRSLLQAPIDIMNPVLHARRWRRYAEAADAYLASGIPYTEIRYEDLLDEPESTVRTVCEAVDLPYTEDLLAFHDAEGTTFDPEEEPWKAKAREPIDPSNKEKWREDLPPGDVSVIEAEAGEAMRSRGYEVSSPSLGPWDRLRAVRRRAGAPLRFWGQKIRWLVEVKLLGRD